VAYDDVALPIAAGQTISQPLVVARMCALLAPQPDELVLDIGTGSGYHAAVLAQLCMHVYSVERLAELSQAADASLRAAGVGNVTLAVGDGSRGWPARDRYHAINVAATASGGVPSELCAQLAPRGRLVAPVRLGSARAVRGAARAEREGGGDAGGASGADDPERATERLVLIVRGRDGALRARRLEQVRFVPLVPSD
jgi:protein-L-isoaspartate(D-aspartate) O-methyltransferase